MKLTSVLVATVGAATALAAPQPDQLAQVRRSFSSRHSHGRRANGAHSNPSIKAAGPGNGAATEVDYFTNWSGAIAEGSGFNYARGTIVVPEPQTPNGTDPTQFYSSVAWVGIDGDLCQAGLIQTGVMMSIQNNDPSYYAWYEWWPAQDIMIIDSTEYPVEAGDSIRMSVYAYNTTAGMTMLENLSKSWTFKQEFVGMEDYPLCLETAEWIVEDWTLGDSLVPFANFTTVTFTDAYTNEGGVGNAVLADIYQNSLLTSCSDNEVDSVTCTYL